MDSKVLAVVLAAGASTRFGSPKQLARIGDQTLMELVQTMLVTSQVDHVAVVLGSNREAVQQYILPEVSIVINADWQEGIASSVRCAAKSAISQNVSHLLLLVCDQPFVTSCLIDRIISLSKFEPEKIVACRYGDTAGVPALFPRNFFDALLELQGDTGAKSVIRKADAVELVDFPEGITDVDFSTDLPGCQAIL